MNLNEKETQVVELVTNRASNFSVISRSHNCLVIETPSYFYKIRSIDAEDPKFLFEEIVREAIAATYQEIGVDWQTYRVQRDNLNFSVQRREKLQVAASSCSLENLIERSAVLKRKVENRLEFPRLTAQLRNFNELKHVCRLSLGRDCADDVANYAFFGEYVVNLADSNFFIALIDANGAWNSGCNVCCVPVSLEYGDFYFTDVKLYDPHSSVAERLYETIGKWWLFSQSANKNIVETRNVVKQECEEMFKSNVKMLTTKKPVEVKVETDFLTLSEERERLALSNCKLHELADG